jgi:hypothetical protein
MTLRELHKKLGDVIEQCVRSEGPEKYRMGFPDLPVVVSIKHSKRKKTFIPLNEPIVHMEAVHGTGDGTLRFFFVLTGNDDQKFTF